MLAKRLVPCLPIALGPSRPAPGFVADLASRARNLQDDGADELWLWIQGDPRLAAHHAICEVAGEMSISVGLEGATCAADVDAFLSAGVDKVVVAASSSGLIESSVHRWGTRAVVARIDAAEADAVALATQAASLGAGELIVCWTATAVGSETDSIRAVSDAVDVPVIAGGAISELGQVRSALLEGRADGALLSLDLIHAACGMAEVKRYLVAAGIVVRGVS